MPGELEGPFRGQAQCGSGTRSFHQSEIKREEHETVTHPMRTHAVTFARASSDTAGAIGIDMMSDLDASAHIGLADVIRPTELIPTYKMSSGGCEWRYSA